LRRNYEPVAAMNALALLAGQRFLNLQNCSAAWAFDPQKHGPT
jgi:hypothetical protein